MSQTDDTVCLPERAAHITFSRWNLSLGRHSTMQCKAFPFFIQRGWALTICCVFMFSKLIKHADFPTMHGTCRVEESLPSLLVCMEFAGLWLQILKPIIQIAATVSGRASVSRTREKTISEIHNKMSIAEWGSYLSAPFSDGVQCSWVGRLRSVMCEMTLN